jgi:hypothetical protein
MGIIAGTNECILKKIWGYGAAGWVFNPCDQFAHVLWVREDSVNTSLACSLRERGTLNPLPWQMGSMVVRELPEPSVYDITE